MIRYGIWFTFLLAVQLSSVLGGNHFYEYYYNKYHHKSHSTTTALSPSTAEISTEQKIITSVSGNDNSLESVERSSTVDFELTKHKNRTSHSYGYTYRYQASNAGLIIGIVLLVLCTLVIIGCCCWRCFTGYRRETKGFVLSNNDPEATRLRHEESLLNQAILPDYTIEAPQHYPPYYQSAPVMQPYYYPVPTMYQQSPEQQMQPHGVPSTPPPPYDTPLYEAPPLRN